MSLVAENLRRIIDEKGLKHTYVAQKAGYGRNEFSRLLNDRKIIKAEDITRLANCLGVTPNDLFSK